MVEALGLTPAQRERIRVIEEEARFRQFRDIRTGKASDAAAMATINRIMAVLNPQQARRWGELAGEPIRGPLSVFPMPFRPARSEVGSRPGREEPERISGPPRYTRQRIASILDRGTFGCGVVLPPERQRRPIRPGLIIL